MSKHSADVREFKRKIRDNRSPKKRRIYSKNHKWRNPKKDDLIEHYMVIMNIPEGMKEYYADRSCPAPRYSRMHGFVRAFGDAGKRKDILNLFPNSTVGDIKCTGDDTCIVCQRIADLKDKMDITGYGNKAEIPDELNKDEKKVALSLVQATDASGKGKRRVIFAGIDMVRSEKEDNQWELKFERYNISEKYWNDDFMPVLADKREEDEEEWKYEDHPNDEYTLGEVTKKLKEFTKKEQSVIFLNETESVYPVVWDMVDAHQLKYVEDGDFGDSKSVMSVRKGMPYFPPEYVKETKGEEKKALTKLIKKSKGLYEWIIENIDTLPDLDDYCPEEITASEQSVLLGVNAEKKTESKMEDVVANKVDDEFFADDEDENEPEETVVDKAEAIKEVDDDEFFGDGEDDFKEVDDDGFDDIEEPC